MLVWAVGGTTGADTKIFTTANIIYQAERRTERRQFSDLSCVSDMFVFDGQLQITLYLVIFVRTDRPIRLINLSFVAHVQGRVTTQVE